MGTQFVETESPATLEMIEAVETELGAKLPQAYVEYLLRYNGGSPDPGTFNYRTPDGRMQRSTVAWFFSVGPHEYENLLEYYKDFEGRVPRDTLPIARDPGGSLILLGVVGERCGKILFWDRENEAPEGEPPWEKNVYPLADSLETFLGMLGPV
jgi:hypothetical protein